MATKPGEPRAFFNSAVGQVGEDCLIWPYAKTAAGYGVLRVDGKNQYTHILSCAECHGPQPSTKHEVAHSCNNTACFRGSHLRWATHKNNMADKYENGTHQLLQTNANAKLTNDDVREIRRLKGTMSQPEIGTLFKVNSKTINKIFVGKSWATLDRVAA